MNNDCWNFKGTPWQRLKYLTDIIQYSLFNRTKIS